MAFNLKQFADLVGIDKETSTYNTPVFKKTLEGGILGEANNDGTIFIDKSLKGKAKEKAVSHEKVHLEQMAQGRLHYDDNTENKKTENKKPPTRHQHHPFVPVRGPLEVPAGSSYSHTSFLQF